MGLPKTQVKDICGLFNNMYGFDYLLVADFYGEDGVYIGSIAKDYKHGDISISDELKPVYRNKVKFSRMYTERDTFREQDAVMFTFVVLKGEEK